MSNQTLKNKMHNKFKYEEIIELKHMKEHLATWKNRNKSNFQPFK